MQDARLRILTTIVLSAGAFISLYGALATLAWWLLLTPRWKALPHPRILLWVMVMIAITSLVSELSGGEGFSYMVRMIAILLIAAWAYSQRQDGELLDVSVWLMGKRIGFDIGLTAEMGMQSLGLIKQDIQQVRQAMAVKGMKFSVFSILPLAANIVMNQLRRTEEMAKMLTVRGYIRGGEIEPHFHTARIDYLLALSSLLVLTTAILSYY
ncbi:MAG: hypothetical protein PHW93_00750 [Candidatus Methanomethylophilaceae archaeon]|nr:hypothetical protein [Candidatus Methanomethylophilaceae archaeon]